MSIMPFRKCRLKHFLALSFILFVSGIFVYRFFELGDYFELQRLTNDVGPLPTGQGPNSVLEHMKFPARFKGKKLAFHQVFEPRKVSFIGYNYSKGSRETASKRPKTILLGTPWNGIWTTINYYFLRPDDTSFTHFGCPNSNCLVTKDETQISEVDAVLFHLLDLPNTLPDYRDPDQIWIAYILEAPWRIRANNIDLTKYYGVFNWTMSYRDDSDVIIKYGFVGPKVDKTSSSVEDTNKVPFVEKKDIVWFVSDCKVPSHRVDYVKELNKSVQVDIYGLCGTKKCFPSQSSVCYEDVLKSYKFYLSFENSICKDYVTEKYFNILEYDIVPIVYGGANYNEIGPIGGFIDATKYPEPKELGRYLKELSSDHDKYSKFLHWKLTYKSYLHPWMCYLCDKLHEPVKKPTVKLDLKKWWMDEAQCRTWDTKEKAFINVD